MRICFTNVLNPQYQANWTIIFLPRIKKTFIQIRTIDLKTLFPRTRPSSVAVCLSNRKAVPGTGKMVLFLLSSQEVCSVFSPKRTLGSRRIDVFESALSACLFSVGLFVCFRRPKEFDEPSKKCDERYFFFLGKTRLQR